MRIPDEPMDLPTDAQTDASTYRNARKQPKIKKRRKRVSIFDLKKKDSLKNKKTEKLKS